LFGLIILSIQPIHIRSLTGLSLRPDASLFKSNRQSLSSKRTSGGLSGSEIIIITKTKTASSKMKTLLLEFKAKVRKNLEHKKVLSPSLNQMTIF